MGEIVMVRHGQASFGADDYDRLSPLGHEQAEWLGQWLHAHGLAFDRVLRGSLRRHRETAEGIARAMALPPVEEDPRFDELHYFPLEAEYLAATGSDAPRDRDGFIAFFPSLFARWERGELKGSGESYAAFAARVSEAVDSAIAPGGNTLVVTSGGVIGATVARVLELSAERAADVVVNIHNASIHRFMVENGRLRLSLYNASPHLDPAERSHARTYV